MRRPWWLVLVLGGLLSLAFAGHDADELEYNRRLLAKWKADPEHAARLQRDLAAFYTLPAERQEQIRALDRQIHEADPVTQVRLWGVLERYTEWLEKLPEAERRAVQEAEDKATVIRGLRQREWIERLPRSIRDELDKLPAEKRIARIKELRLQERRQRVAWQRSLGGKDDPVLQPRHMRDFPSDVQTFLQKELLPRLNKMEQAALNKAEGNWPDYPKLIATLSDRYPVLPEGPLGKIGSFKKLPTSVKERLRQDKSMKARMLVRADDKERWPDYALAVNDVLRGERGLPPLGASRLGEFPTEIRTFLEKSLLPKLSMMEQADLQRNEGRWPEYPRRLLMFARKYHLVIPGMSLPGPREMWDAARVARQELPPEERAAIDLVGFDLKDGLERLKKAGNKKPPKTGPGWGKMGKDR
jgi:hypothetical protein